MFFKCFFCWGTPQQRGDLSSAQAICVQACGNLEDDSPSQTNLGIAYAVADCQASLGLPVFAQGEVADILRVLGHRYVKRTKTQAELREGSEPYSNTHHEAMHHKLMCDCLGLSRAIVFAYAPSHIWRCIWAYERLGLTVIVPPEIPIIVWGERLYQKRLIHPYTHIPFEILARLVFLYRGYI